jgi:glutaredoxin
MKTFESFNSKKMIEEDIIGALVYLFDEGYDAKISWYKSEYSFDLVISKDDHTKFNTNDVKNELLTIKDLMKIKFKDASFLFLYTDFNSMTQKTSSREYPENKEVYEITLYFQGNTEVIEAFGYSESDYLSEVERILKSYDLRPTQINDIINFYQDMIEEYKESGKVPQVFVNDIKDIINLDDSGNMFQIKVPSKPSGIMLKYL